ncbi:hypothetical protein SPI_08032 [Niveomyces insectorum RCEF 264]|uniref:Uncharacterized protein n=1 Tax=Niveomyces insectorum RCEF 264 TaxID=1081102 RepID=A0A162IE31_9HYPO|nr:hypothetical protein SPI_08032 [Niveomyces insectorum RCEF 264]
MPRWAMSSIFLPSRARPVSRDRISYRLCTSDTCRSRSNSSSRRASFGSAYTPAPFVGPSNDTAPYRVRSVSKTRVSVESNHRYTRPEHQPAPTPTPSTPPTYYDYYVYGDDDAELPRPSAREDARVYNAYHPSVFSSPRAPSSGGGGGSSYISRYQRPGLSGNTRRHHHNSSHHRPRRHNSVAHDAPSSSSTGYYMTTALAAAAGATAVAAVAATPSSSSLSYNHASAAASRNHGGDSRHYGHQNQRRHRSPSTSSSGSKRVRWADETFDMSGRVDWNTHYDRHDTRGRSSRRGEPDLYGDRYDPRDRAPRDATRRRYAEATIRPRRDVGYDVVDGDATRYGRSGYGIRSVEGEDDDYREEVNRRARKARDRSHTRYDW